MKKKYRNIFDNISIYIVKRKENTSYNKINMLFYFAKVLTETGPGLSITYVYIKIIYISFNFFY